MFIQPERLPCFKLKSAKNGTLMKNTSKNWIIVFIFSLIFPFFATSASISNHHQPQKPHIGDFQSDQPKCTCGHELYLIETATGYNALLLVRCTRSMERFISRDPLGYVDGMGLYNGYFAQGFSLDPEGTKLMVRRLGNKKTKVIELLNILSKNNASLDDKGYVKFPANYEPKSLSEKLIYALVKCKKTIYIEANKRDPWLQDNLYVRVGSLTKRERYLFTNLKTGEIKSRPLWSNDKEMAVILAHELIHAYYRHCTNDKRSSKEKECLIPASEGGYYKSEIKIEELYTVGMVLLVKKTSRNYQMNLYDGEFTANKIRTDLGIEWERSSYFPKDDNRNMQKLTDKELKKIKKDDKQSETHYRVEALK